MNPSISDLRLNYTRQSLLEADIHPDPIHQFQTWFEQAIAANLLEPNAMTLATATPSGTPSARIVLLKAVDPRGFVFYTNYNSQKGQELSANPQAALVFLWGELERQVRVEGTLEKIAAQETEAYFQSRPHSSRLGAWASEQSCVIPDREVLEQRLADLTQKYARSSGAASAALGWIPSGSLGDRILARATESVARSLPLSIGGESLDD
jgi:pyridoxamine 5'-phosphate oxidase